MDTMRITITFSKQEVHPARASGLVVEMRDAVSSEPSSLLAGEIETADRYASLILGPECLVRSVGMVREYLPRYGGEWSTVMGMSAPLGQVEARWAAFLPRHLTIEEQPLCDRLTVRAQNTARNVGLLTVESIRNLDEADLTRKVRNRKTARELHAAIRVAWVDPESIGPLPSTLDATPYPECRCPNDSGLHGPTVYRG